MNGRLIIKKPPLQKSEGAGSNSWSVIRFGGEALKTIRDESPLPRVDLPPSQFGTPAPLLSDVADLEYFAILSEDDGREKCEVLFHVSWLPVRPL